MAQEISLRPYVGRLFVAHSKKDYEKSHMRIFREPDALNISQSGRFSAGKGRDGMWTYLVWAKNQPSLAHEMAHVVFIVFENCGIDPRNDDGEAFCYMLSQLLIDAKRKR